MFNFLPEIPWITGTPVITRKLSSLTQEVCWPTFSKRIKDSQISDSTPAWFLLFLFLWVHFSRLYDRISWNDRNKNSRIQDQAQPSFHYQKRHRNKLLNWKMFWQPDNTNTQGGSPCQLCFSQALNMSQSNAKISILTANTALRYSINQGALLKYTY